MNKRKRKQLFITAVDLALLYLSLYLALYLRKGIIPSPSDWQIHISIFRFIFIWWIICFYTAGMYNLAVIFDKFLLLRRLFMAAAIATFGTIALFYVYKAPGISPKTVLALFSISVAILVYINRQIYAKIQTSFVKKMGVAYVGPLNNSVRELFASPKGLERLNYSFRALLVEGSCDEPLPEGVKLCLSGGDLAQAVFTGEIQLIVIGDESSLSQGIRSLMFGLLQAGASYINLFDFYEQIFRKTPLEDIDEAWFLKNIDLSTKKPYIAIKRMLDILLSGVLLAISLPFWPLIALFIVLDSPGPVFFMQTRIGRLSKQFRIIKFRSMRVENNHMGPTISNDTRITLLGRALRKTRIDEIPQLINVLVGEMSFVGPRPERPELAEDLERDIPYYKQRLLVKPGLTGWDQVSGEYHSPSREDTFKKLQADLYYVKNFSLSLDISIFFKTIFTVLRASGR
jgi:exopolysaccharide biosynthesis polyprenyl glycosylphosphotransferase